MKATDVSGRPRRHDRFLKEHVHDPYKLRKKLPEPTRCPRCGAVYADGRWTWSERLEGEAHDELCQACRRIADEYPAGEVAVSGEFAAAHRDEIVNLARNVEQAENAEHPLHRIMEVRDEVEATVITTTDVHLPRAIGHAIENAWQGELQTHYDEEGCFVRVNWRR